MSDGGGGRYGGGGGGRYDGGGVTTSGLSDDGSLSGSNQYDAGGDGSYGGGGGNGGSQDFAELNNPSSAVYQKIVYFDYDASTIEPQYADLLRAHIGFLRQKPGARVMLQGHTDERGTRSYNLALGDRRTDAVRGFLLAEGVPAGQITTLSYGEERPADAGHDERAWSLNRRVELVY
ncbi:peptidoglycan-associated lipoprotein Pal [Rhodopseudomonas palustris]|uniref:Peptidoglycan-associated protein n=2 Tax=Thiospirillum jenense TaxID=1653858 RepID=A0A839HG47_9GAMM|nr:peptidoglycan-associated lipoprotein Pal [Thiospirillum jenense]MBB1091996.1 peptidoglycan-associated lipoprotein Pal [Rhodopseudomonas palustris]MBB1126286.1 peptidoglycan-associated lipoprotein Pal [Thiospirillum jenense]